MSSCGGFSSNKENPNQIQIFNRNHELKETMFQKSNFKIRNDSIIEFCQTLWDLVDTLTYEYQFSLLMDHKYGDQNEISMRLIDVQSFYCEGKNYKIYKYFLDYKNVFDEESVIYFNPELGIMKYVSFIWQRYGVYCSHSLVDSKTIFCLIDNINNCHTKSPIPMPPPPINSYR